MRVWEGGMSIVSRRRTKPRMCVRQLDKAILMEGRGFTMSSPPARFT